MSRPGKKKMTDYYSMSQLIDLYGISRRTFIRWIRAGKHPDFDRWGDNGKKLWRVNKIERWQARNGK